MASSVSSVNSSYSSIYGNRNVISGLASGLDTESLIENAVSGYQTKITSLQQDMTKLEWEQEAYQSIITKLIGFTGTYTSYTSNTNLLSASFFSNATTTSTGGEFKELVSATGKSNSDIQLLGVKQLAAAASYTVNGIGTTTNSEGLPSIEGSALDLSGTKTVSTVTGSFTIRDGSRSYTVTFDEDDIYDASSGQNQGEWLAGKINEKLGEINVTLSGGDTTTADKQVSAVVNANGGIDLVNHGQNNVYISSATGDIKSTLNIETGNGQMSFDVAPLTKEVTNLASLNNRKVGFTVDGVTKEIDVGALLSDLGETVDAAGLADALNRKLESEFGKDKVTVGVNEDGGLSFATKAGSTMKITNGKALGLASDLESTYANLSKTIGDIMGDGADTYTLTINGVDLEFEADTALEAVINKINGNSAIGVNVTYSETTNQFKFTAEETGSAGNIEFEGELAEKLFGGGTHTEGKDAVFSMTVNGVTYEDISRSSNSFSVDGLTMNLKGTFNYEADTNNLDAEGYILDPSTGKRLTDLSGSEVKGLYTDDEGYYTDADGNRYQDGAGNYVKAFEEGGLVANAEAVTFTTSVDSEKIIEGVKSMIETYNTMVTEIKKAYSTEPLTNSSGNYYEPLTDDDQADMSESAIKSYEEKAKTGLLYGDSDLSTLYNKLVGVITSNASELSAIGITAAYNDGLTTLTLDESKMKSALETDPDSVKETFIRSTGNGDSSNGLMQSFKNIIDSYARTTGASKGILIEKAGSTLAPTSVSNNVIYNKISDIQDQIESWQDKLSDKVDYYTQQFTLLEQLINEMNSQSSALAGLMGG